MCHATQYAVDMQLCTLHCVVCNYAPLKSARPSEDKWISSASPGGCQLLLVLTAADCLLSTTLCNLLSFVSFFLPLGLSSCGKAKLSRCKNCCFIIGSI